MDEETGVTSYPATPVDMGTDALEAIDVRDLDATLPTDMRISIANLMLAWGSYDSAVTYWLAKVLGTPLDVASIIFGAMQTETKLSKLKTIFEHYGMTEAASGLKGLMAAHKQRVIARNAVAHSRCAGRSRAKPDHFAFSAVTHVKGEPGMLALTLVPLDEVLLSAKFADESGRQIMELASKTPRIIADAHPDE